MHPSELKTLAGKLSWVSCVVPAHPFLCRLFNLISKVKKPFCKIRITQEVLANLNTRLTFLQNYNGITDFRSLKMTSSDAIHKTDNPSFLGVGASYGPKWIPAAFPSSWKKCHVGFRKLYPMYVLISMFGENLTHSTVLPITDHQSFTHNINNQTSKCKLSMCILRFLVLKLIEFNIHLTKFIMDKTDFLSDRTSRFQVTE